MKLAPTLESKGDEDGVALSTKQIDNYRDTLLEYRITYV